MSEQTSVGEASSTAPGDTDYAGSRPGAPTPLEGAPGPFACYCEFPKCENVTVGYCKMHRIFLEGI